MSVKITPKQANDLVDSLWEAVNHGGRALSEVPSIVSNILVSGAWKRRAIRTGEIITHNRFVDFITTKPLAGCGWKPDMVESLIRDNAETLVLWREAMKGKEGGDKKGKTTCYNITGDKSRTGTSRSYTLARLKHQKPELFQEVVDGKLSANAAAIAAGFRKKRSPLQNLRAAWAKATADERRQFLSEVACP